MKKPTRRSFLRPVGVPAGMSASGGSEAAMDGQSRRAFLQGTAGAAAGAAAFLVIPKAASVALDAHGASTSTAPAPVPIKRSGSAPAEPVTAYVHNADRHEVVVMWGQNEVTFKDPALVKRLLDATR